MFVCLLCGFEVSNAQDKSPVDVVNLFDSHYGGPDMDVIAGYTTAKFRLSRPKSVWVVDGDIDLEKITAFRDEK